MTIKDMVEEARDFWFPRVTKEQKDDPVYWMIRNIVGFIAVLIWLMIDLFLIVLIIFLNLLGDNFRLWLLFAQLGILLVQIWLVYIHTWRFKDYLYRLFGRAAKPKK